jgi:SAM-dependent methyltransferase
LERVIELTPTPPANAFVKSNRVEVEQSVFPLDIFFCKNCSHVQLLDVIDPKILFSEYVYVSGTAPLFVDHFRRYASDVVTQFTPKVGSLVVDIGSNDGTLLSFFKDAGVSVLGIDPAKKIVKEANRNGIETIEGFFNQSLAEKILVSKGPASIITANNVFAHADDLEGIIQGVRSLLAPDGIFIFEVSYLADVIEKTLFDTIYHEHLSYHSVGPLRRFFAQNGMNMFGAYRVDTHGGSLRGICQLADGPYSDDGTVSELITLEQIHALHRVETFRNFARGIEVLKYELNTLLEQLKSDGKNIAGYGAPAKATTLMYHFNIGLDVVDFIVDDSPLKQGLYSPGRHIPIVSSYQIEKQPPNFLLVLAWNFAEAIISNNQNYQKKGGQFIIPLPKVEVR